MSEAVLGNEQLHEIMTGEFTQRYLDRSGFSKLTYTTPYDPANPACDYDRTWWPAEPNRLSLPIGMAVLGKMHYMDRAEMKRSFVAPFFNGATNIADALKDFPVMLVNGHSPDLQASAAQLSACAGIATAQGNRFRFQSRLEDMIDISHGVATRNLVPITIGHPKLPKGISFLRLMQLTVNGHFSIPRTDSTENSSLPNSFMDDYNRRLASEVVESAKSRTDHPLGFQTFWSLAPTAGLDQKGEDEQEGKLITREIKKGTIGLILRMGVGLLPVYTSFGKGKGPNHIELGRIIPPNEVNRHTVPGIAVDLAEYRRSNGETNVYAAEELQAT